MRCEEALTRAADPAEAPPDPELSSHLAACAACREAVAEAREAEATLREFERTSGPETELPPADAAAAWTAAEAARRVPAPAMRGLLRTAGRIAAAVLATVGGFALLGARVEAAETGAAFVLPLPWTSTTVRATTPARDAAVTALRETLVAKLDLLAAQLDATDAAQAERLDESLAVIDERGRSAAQTLLAEVASLRRDMAALEWAQDAVAATDRAMPALPDPR
jgi:hypothetical protein